MRWIPVLRTLLLGGALALIPPAPAGAAAAAPAGVSQSCVLEAHGVLWYCPPTGIPHQTAQPQWWCRTVGTGGRLYYCKPGGPVLTPGDMAVGGIVQCATRATRCPAYVLRSREGTVALTFATGPAVRPQIGEAAEVVGTWRVVEGRLALAVQQLIPLWPPVSA